LWQQLWYPQRPGWRNQQERTTRESRVEAAELRDSHESTGRYESSEVCRADIELLEHPPLRLASVKRLGLIDVVCEMTDLVLNLLLGTIGKDSSDDCGRLFRLPVVDELTRRLRAEREKSG
jgi:hypothetical protein